MYFLILILTVFLHCLSLFMLLVHAKNKLLNAWQSDSIFFLPILDLPIKNSICICVNLVLKFHGDKITFWREFQIEKRQEAEIHIVSLVVLLNKWSHINHSPSTVQWLSSTDRFPHPLLASYSHFQSPYFHTVYPHSCFHF